MPSFSHGPLPFGLFSKANSKSFGKPNVHAHTTKNYNWLGNSYFQQKGLHQSCSIPVHLAASGIFEMA